MNDKSCDIIEIKKESHKKFQYCGTIKNNRKHSTCFNRAY